jgi:cytoskeletal protein RodZ
VIVNKDKKPIDGITQLKKLNLKEVSEKTHISLKILNYIINSDFEKLSPAKTIGFLRILEKEYDLNFDEWHVSYMKYVKHEEDVEAREELLHDFEKKSMVPYILAGVIACILVVYFVYPKFVEDEKNILIEKQNLSTINNDLEKNINLNIENNTTKKVEESVLEQKIVIENSEEKLIDNNKNIQNVQLDKVSNTKEEIVEKNSNASIDKDVQDSDKNKLSFEFITKIPLENNNTIKITTGNKIWIGLSISGIKDDMMISKIKEFNLKENTILFTGHGFFTLYSFDKEYKYRTMEKKYFYVEDSILYEVNRDTFNKLDKENVW